MSKLSIVISVLQSMLPYFLLFLFPLRDRLRFRNRVNIPVVLVYILGATFILFHSVEKKSTEELPLLLLSAAFMSAAGLVCWIFLKGRFIINIFYLFVIKSYWDIIYLISITNKPFHFLYNSGYPFEDEVLDRVLLTVVTFPLLYVFIVKLLKPLIDKTEQHSFWRHLWYIPFLFFLCFYIIIINHIEVLCSNFPLIPEIWILVTFLTYYLILRMLNEAVRVRKLEELPRLANIQEHIQGSQYRDLLANIEAMRMQRHDLRHILLALEGYVQKEDLAGFRQYVHQYEEEHFKSDEPE